MEFVKLIVKSHRSSSPNAQFLGGINWREFEFLAIKNRKMRSIFIISAVFLAIFVICEAVGPHTEKKDDSVAVDPNFGHANAGIWKNNGWVGVKFEFSAKKLFFNLGFPPIQIFKFCSNFRIFFFYWWKIRIKKYFFSGNFSKIFKYFLSGKIQFWNIF